MVKIVIKKSLDKLILIFSFIFINFIIVIINNNTIHNLKMETQQLSIIDRVKTFEDALAIADDQSREECLKSLEGYNTPDEVAYKKLKLITKVINEGWVADYKDYTQKKYCLWFGSQLYGANVGLLFVYCICSSGDSYAYIGSHLNYPTREKAEYVGNQFLPLWNDFLF